MINTYISQELLRVMNDFCSRRSDKEIINESNKLFKWIEQDLEKVISGKEEILITRVVDRKVGKTYSLVKLGIKYNLPIVVRNDMEKFYRHTAREFFNADVTILPLGNLGKIRGLHTDIVLKDQGVKTEEIINFFRPEKIKIIGYDSIFDE